MSCTTDYIDFVCSQLNGMGEIRPKKMFNDWLIYINGKSQHSVLIRVANPLQT